MKVLFCTDGSKSSFNAIINYSQWFNNLSVDVLSVSDMTYFSDEIYINNRILEQCSNNVINILKSSEKFLNQNGIKGNNYIKKCGSAIDNILDTEQEEKYEFIVMGSNGKTGIQKWLGSVSQEIAYKSASRVYISKNIQKTKNILIPIYPSLNYKSGLKNLLNNMNLCDAKIHLMSVYQMPQFLFYTGNIDSNWISDVEKAQQNEAVKAISNVENLFINNGLNIHDKLVTKGDPFEMIHEYIQNNNISLIITGMKNKKNNISHSSTSRKILEYATCDVIIDKDI